MTWQSLTFKSEWIKAKHRTVRRLELRHDDEDQDENEGGRGRTLIRFINHAGSEYLVANDCPQIIYKAGKWGLGTEQEPTEE